MTITRKNISFECHKNTFRVIRKRNNQMACSVLPSPAKKTRLEKTNFEAKLKQTTYSSRAHSVVLEDITGPALEDLSIDFY